MELRGVKIGDKFISNQHRKSKRVSTVVDFVERKSMISGKVFDYEVVAEHEFMGQKITTYPSFTTVLRNKVMF